MYLYIYIWYIIYTQYYSACRDMQLDSNSMQPGSRLAYGWKDDTGVDPIRVSQPRLPHKYLAMSALDNSWMVLDVSNVRHATNLNSDSHGTLIAVSCLNSSLRTILQKPPSKFEHRNYGEHIYVKLLPWVSSSKLTTKQSLESSGWGS